MKREILLSYFPKMTTKRVGNLRAVFTSMDEVWATEFSELKEKLPWEENLIHEFLLWRDEINEEKVERVLHNEKIHCITQDDEEYPELLKEIYDPPLCLFVRGAIPQDGFNLAVVGPRKFSQYGKQVAEELVRQLAAQGITIVSGLALGIDGIAHNAALAAEGTTVAVLGTGIDRQHIYPRVHSMLSEKIIEQGGAVIAEYPPGTLPNRFTFPRRNRIVAGMSLGTLVIEATEKSGALITAQCALDTNREVFAVPQNITSPTSVGTNNLLTMGAKPVMKAEDILDALNLQEVAQYVTNTTILPDSPTEAKVLEHLSREPVHIDELIRKSGLESHVVNGTMTLMEMKGKIRNLGGMMYVLAR
jgi:DNA processing protein